MGMIPQKTQENYKLIKITRKGDREEDPEDLKCNNRNPKEIQKIFLWFKDRLEATA